MKTNAIILALRLKKMSDKMFLYNRTISFEELATTLHSDSVQELITIGMAVCDETIERKRGLRLVNKFQIMTEKMFRTWLKTEVDEVV